MTSEEKIHELRGIIDCQLRPLITNDYVLWGLPYYSNIGDVLIWQGEMDFLRTIPYKCLGICAWNDYPNENGMNDSFRLDKSTTILIQGGGYLGDVWRKGWEYVLEAIKSYSDNKIILLPNTIFYADDKYLQQDITSFAAQKNLIICARDKISYDFAQQHFSAQTLLVPDMAFYISIPYIQKWVQPTGEKELYLKRLDKEAVSSSAIEHLEHVAVHDWPTLEPGFSRLSFKIYYQVIRFRRTLTRRIPWSRKFVYPLADFILDNFFRPETVKIGVGFLSQYKHIYSTRLHVLILSIILGKEVTSEDNSYGKLSSFYDTWLTGTEGVTIKR